MRIAKKVERWRRETTPVMSTLRRLVVRCLIIYVFPIYVRAFFVTPPTSCLPRHQALHFISPIPPPRIGPYQVFFFGGLELICMRAALRSALIATGGHLGIKKCQTTGHSPFSNPRPAQYHPPELPLPLPQPIYWHQSTKHYYYDPPAPLSVKNCIMHKLFWFHSARSKHAYGTPISTEEQLFIKKSSLIVWKEIMLILHFASAS